MAPKAAAVFVLFIGACFTLMGVYGWTQPAPSESDMKVGKCTGTSLSSMSYYVQVKSAQEEGQTEKRTAQLTATYTTQFTPDAGGASQQLSNSEMFSHSIEQAGTFSGPSQSELDQQPRAELEKRAEEHAKTQAAGACWMVDGIGKWFAKREQLVHAVESANTARLVMMAVGLGGGACVLLFGLYQLSKASAGDKAE